MGSICVQFLYRGCFTGKFLEDHPDWGKEGRDRTPAHCEAPCNRYFTARGYLMSLLTCCLIGFLYEIDLLTEAACSKVEFPNKTDTMSEESKWESSWGKVGEYRVCSELIRLSVLWTFSGLYNNEEVNSITDAAAVEEKFACGFKCERRQRSSVLLVVCACFLADAWPIHMHMRQYCHMLLWLGKNAGDRRKPRMNGILYPYTYFNTKL